MIFHSSAYGVFLVLVFVAWWAMARLRTPRVLLLIVASYFFYGSWNAKYVLLIFASTAFDYWMARAIASSADPQRRKQLVTLSVVGNLGLLCYFKYYNFFRDTADHWLGLPLPVLDVLLPVGISFYTFQSLSYTIDVYRGTLAPARNLREFMLFVAFFPQLVAGPIVRASEFLPQLEHPPRVTRDDIHEGLWRILVGLTKKVLISDVIAVNLVDIAYTQGGPTQGWTLVLALYAYLIQIYGDFSGYSDVAIGSALLFGFKLPENFRTPFRSRSMLEFWRRWHISLSFWLRDYLYISLGGNRYGVLRSYWNLFVTMLLSGLWHGAGWNMVLWGAAHGGGLVFNRWWNSRFAMFTSRLGQIVSWFLACTFFGAAMILFRTQSLAHAGDVCVRLFQPTSALVLPWPVWLSIAVGVATHALPDPWQLAGKRLFCALPSWAVGILVSLFVGLLAAGGPTGVPFMYFQF